jgi:hypothetical protein
MILGDGGRGEDGGGLILLHWRRGCACVRVCVCVCVCVCLCVRACVCNIPCAPYLHDCKPCIPMLRVGMHACTHAHTHTHACVCVRACVRIPCLAAGLVVLEGPLEPGRGGGGRERGSIECTAELNTPLTASYAACIREQSLTVILVHYDGVVPPAGASRAVNTTR